MVNGMDRHDPCGKNELDLCPVWHYCGIYTRESFRHWNHLCASTTKVSSRKWQWSTPPEKNSLRLEAVSLILIWIHYRATYKARSLCFKVWSLPVYEQLTHCYYLCWWHLNIWMIWSGNQLIKQLKNHTLLSIKKVQQRVILALIFKGTANI